MTSGAFGFTHVFVEVHVIRVFFLYASLLLLENHMEFEKLDLFRIFIHVEYLSIMDFLRGPYITY